MQKIKAAGSASTEWRGGCISKYLDRNRQGVAYCSQLAYSWRGFPGLQGRWRFYLL